MSTTEHDLDDLISRTEDSRTEFFVEWRYDFFDSLEPSCREEVISARHGEETAEKIKAHDSRVISAAVFKKTVSIEVIRY